MVRSRVATNGSHSGIPENGHTESTRCASTESFKRVCFVSLPSQPITFCSRPNGLSAHFIWHIHTVSHSNLCSYSSTPLPTPLLHLACHRIPIRFSISFNCCMFLLLHIFQSCNIQSSRRGSLLQICTVS